MVMRYDVTSGTVSIVNNTNSIVFSTFLRTLVDLCRLACYRHCTYTLHCHRGVLGGLSDVLNSQRFCKERL